MTRFTTIHQKAQPVSYRTAEGSQKQEARHDRGNSCSDVLNYVQLNVFVRYSWDGHFVEHLLFCKMVPGRTTGEQIFNILDNFMTETNLHWENCVAVCTDGAAVMIGSKSGVVARIKRMNPQIAVTHCMLHRVILASKDMALELHSVLSTVVHDVVNIVKSKPLQSRLFYQLCNEMGAGHNTLLFHSEVQWLSRGIVLQRLFELRTELCDFLKDARPITAVFLSDPKWVVQLAYIADVFNILNEIHLYMQGGYVSVLEISDKIKASMGETEIWRMPVLNGITDLFP